MSSTPLTDAEQVYASCLEGEFVVPADFARQLEKDAARYRWQPIETAPYGVDVLLTDRAGRMAVACRDSYGDWLPVNVDTTYDMAYGELAIDEPTHWMPLPEPPQAKEER